MIETRIEKVTFYSFLLCWASSLLVVSIVLSMIFFVNKSNSDDLIKVIIFCLFLLLSTVVCLAANFLVNFVYRRWKNRKSRGSYMPIQ
jgi:uncharacterized membrane protein YhaH (DUF805 family)